MNASHLDQIANYPTSQLATILENIERYMNDPRYAAEAQAHLRRSKGGVNIRARTDDATRQLRNAVKAEIEKRAKGKGRG